MTIQQQAIEEATEAHLRHNPIESLNLGQYRSQITCSCGHTYQIDGHSEDRQESFLDHVNSDALTAALPALEAELRDEIEAEAVRLENTTHLHNQDQNAARAFIAGVRHAAQIARGRGAEKHSIKGPYYPTGETEWTCSCGETAVLIDPAKYGILPHRREDFQCPKDTQ